MIFSPLAGRPYVTQNFGARPEYYAKYDLAGHNGYDCRCATGTGLYAPCEGYVHYGDNGKSGYGKFVEITSLPYLKDGTRRQVTLAHLSRFIAGLEGQFVAAGDLVGISGNSGDSTAAHVHITYKKLDKDANVINSGNGYHGAVDIGQYVQLWEQGARLITF